jgi:unsaturated rhamnogalacturonyl hydrolase
VPIRRSPTRSTAGHPAGLGRSGLFHDVLDDPASFEETNLARMLAYARFSGVRDGWLPARYRDVANSLLETAGRQVDGDDSSPVCGAPRFDRPGISVEAQAFHLLAGAAERSARP